MSRQADPPRPRSGSLVAGRYEIRAEIGRGAMGTVYEVEDRQGGDVLALKVLRTELARDEEAVERFRREAMVLLDLRHPSIVRTFDFGFLDEGLSYLTMELVRGETLRRRLERVGRMEPEDLRPMVDDLCGALGAAHHNGVIHRDIKPHNVIFTDGADPSGVTAKLLDFGIAKVTWDAPMTGAGVSLGTLRYASPEQLKGAGDVDERADVYSLGIVIYEALAGLGELPFLESAEMIGAIFGDQRIPLSERRPEVPEALSTLLLGATAMDRSKRPATARALSEAYAQALAGV